MSNFAEVWYDIEERKELIANDEGEMLEVKGSARQRRDACAISRIGTTLARTGTTHRLSGTV